MMIYKSYIGEKTIKVYREGKLFFCYETKLINHAHYIITYEMLMGIVGKVFK